MLCVPWICVTHDFLPRAFSDKWGNGCSLLIASRVKTCAKWRMCYDCERRTRGPSSSFTDGMWRVCSGSLLRKGRKSCFRKRDCPVVLPVLLMERLTMHQWRNVALALRTSCKKPPREWTVVIPSVMNVSSAPDSSAVSTQRSMKYREIFIHRSFRRCPCQSLTLQGEVTWIMGML